MRDFFDEYGWTLITCVGGMIGLSLMFHLCWGGNSQLAGVMSNYLTSIVK